MNLRARPSLDVRVQRRVRLPLPLEKHEQAAGVKLLRSLGAAVYVIGTTRRRGDHHGTMQTFGIADIEAFLPPPKFRAWPASHRRRLLKWEVKRARASRVSEAQTCYGDNCASAWVDYVRGDCAALATWLTREGYIR